MNKQEKIKNLETGKGIQYLLDAAYKIFGNPIVVFDTYYSLIAFTEDVNDDPLWNTLISTGTFSMEVQEFFSSEQFTESVANADKQVIMKSDKLKYDRILSNVFNREHIKVANIVMVECKTPFGKSILTDFEVFADKVMEEIKDDNYYIAYGRDYHDALINKILDGQIIDTFIYTSHVQILYDGFQDYLYLAAINTGNGTTRQNDHSNLKQIRDMLIQRYPSFKFGIYSDYILMIISSKYINFSPEIIIEDRQENIFAHNNLFVGISSSFENIYELDKYYNEAVTALKNGIAADNKQNIFQYGSA
jgi:hypothetical protein